jgi:hypothetical protein
MKPCAKINPSSLELIMSGISHKHKVTGREGSCCWSSGSGHTKESLTMDVSPEKYLLSQTHSFEHSQFAQFTCSFFYLII